MFHYDFLLAFMVLMNNLQCSHEKKWPQSQNPRWPPRWRLNIEKCLFSQKLLGIDGTLVLPTNRNMDLIYSYTKFQGHTRSPYDVTGHMTLQMTVNLLILLYKTLFCGSIAKIVAQMCCRQTISLISLFG